MVGELDPNAITSRVLSDLIKTSFSNVMRGASAAVSTAWEKVFSDFSPYMETTYLKNSRVRILCQKESPVNFYDVYVSSGFSQGAKSLSDDELLQQVNEQRKIIITGNGGAGKTFAMRHVWLQLFRYSSTLTPIFVELRNLNDLTSINLKSFIIRTISSKKELTEEVFDHLCESGRFCFIFDGFDEVVPEQREQLQKQILQLSSQFANCPFLVSSRFDRRFSGWGNFEIFQSLPFNIEQVKHLIGNVPFDPSSKGLFLRQLDDKFFSRNSSFLSNPLLAIMMMMTFRENMDIPSKMSIFYDQAFNTLFQWHDATKAYNRKKTLDIDEFRKSFGIFCLLSYHNQMYEFSHSELVELVNKSLKICSIQHAATDVIIDYEECVNLIRQDGINYVFIHRSFQEYFAAYAITTMMPDKFQQFMPRLQEQLNDNVIPLCFEMNKRLVVKDYINVNFEEYFTRNYFDRSESPSFAVFNRLGVSYELHPDFRVSKRTGRRIFQGISSIRINIDQDFNNFLEIVFTLRLVKRGLILAYVQSALFKNEIFEILKDLKIPDDLLSISSLTIAFEPDRIKMLVNRSSDDTSSTEEDIDLSSQIVNNVDMFKDIQRQLIKVLRETETWCKNEIIQLEQRGQSIDQILGI